MGLNVIWKILVINTHDLQFFLAHRHRRTRTMAKEQVDAGTQSLWG